MAGALVIHLLDERDDSLTRCGMAVTGTSFEYDLGTYGHDEIRDLGAFPLRDPSEGCELCRETLEQGAVRLAAVVTEEPK